MFDSNDILLSFKFKNESLVNDFISYENNKEHIKMALAFTSGIFSILL